MRLRHLLTGVLPAIIVGMALRLFFIAKFPYSAGDTALYQELARNLLDFGVFGVWSDGVLVPVDVRMPGYPLFLAAIGQLLGPGDERIMVVQAGIDVVTCLGIARLAEKLNPRAVLPALWLAALCPFTANYTATPLTETLAIALTTAALLLFCEEHWLAGSIAVGLATLVRPESPLLLIAAGLALAWQRRREVFGAAFRPLLRVAAVMAAGLLLALLPWGYRNWQSVGSFSLLANPDAILPWERSPAGFGDWTRTWLTTSRDTYNVPFKFEEEAIDPRDLPPRAYDSEEERLRTVALLERYNETRTCPPDLDAQFAQLARERAARHPLRQYLVIPPLRALHFWLTPRIQPLPFEGKVWPLAQAWEDDPLDFSVTVGFFVLNLVYLVLGIWGLWRWSGSYPVTMMTLFIVIRTAFMTTHNTIEPRYLLVCFPVLLASGAGILARRASEQPPIAH